MLGLVGIIGAALGLALLPIASAVAAQFVVIDSTSPGLPAGAIVEGTRLVSIAEGERVTLVPEDGNTRTIRGPFLGCSRISKRRELSVLSVIKIFGTTEAVL